MKYNLDKTTGVCYFTLTDAPVARTHSVTNLIMVDLDANNDPIGIEFAMNFNQVSEEDWIALSQAYPSLSEAIRDHLRQETEFATDTEMVHEGVPMTTQLPLGTIPITQSDNIGMSVFSQVFAIKCDMPFEIPEWLPSDQTPTGINSLYWSTQPA